jgi:hypothetical protein
VRNARGTQVRNSWWSKPTNWDTVCRRARGRANYNSLRRLQAQLRWREVLHLWWQWRDKPGLQTLIAAHLGVHKSTICRDLQRLFPLMTDCQSCGQLKPRYWAAEG